MKLSRFTFTFIYAKFKLPFLNTILFPGLPKPIHVKQVFEGQAGLLAGTDLRISSP